MASDLEKNLEKRPLWPLGDALAAKLHELQMLRIEKPTATEASNGRRAHGRPCPQSTISI